MNFTQLTDDLRHLHFALVEKASRAVNISLTSRNWFVGRHLYHYEQSGLDRAQYGTQLIEKTAKSLSIQGLGIANLRTCRQFYLTYPKLLSAQDFSFLAIYPIHQTVSGESDLELNDGSPIHQTVSGELPESSIRQTLSAKSEEQHNAGAYTSELIRKLSFSHFQELLQVKEDQPPFTSANA